MGGGNGKLDLYTCHENLMNCVKALVVVDTKCNLFLVEGKIKFLFDMAMFFYLNKLEEFSLIFRYHLSNCCLSVINKRTSTVKSCLTHVIIKYFSLQYAKQLKTSEFS